jgi:cytochrome oxidase assembly protein ShyY1
MRNQDAINVSSIANVQNYMPAFAQGSFDSNRYWLLDNRTNKGKVGFHVLAWFQLSASEAIIVNRGWIAGDISRRTLPVVEIPIGQLTLQGDIWSGSDKSFTLSKADDELLAKDNWPRVIQEADITVLRAEFPELLPFILRENEGEVGSLVVNHSIVNQPPARHIGYAVQWFAMALALLVLFVFLNTVVPAKIVVTDKN